MRLVGSELKLEVQFLSDELVVVFLECQGPEVVQKVQAGCQVVDAPAFRAN